MKTKKRLGMWALERAASFLGVEIEETNGAYGIHRTFMDGRLAVAVRDIGDDDGHLQLHVTAQKLGPISALQLSAGIDTTKAGEDEDDTAEFPLQTIGGEE